jgi:hypothetical protein
VELLYRRIDDNVADVKRPPGNWVASSLQGRIVLTEGKVRQNFLGKSYEPKKRGVKEILDIKCLCFHLLTKINNSDRKRIILRYARLGARVKLIN